MISVCGLFICKRSASIEIVFVDGSSPPAVFNVITVPASAVPPSREHKAATANVTPYRILNSPLASVLVAHAQSCDEGGLRDLHFAELPHALLAFLLLVQKLTLAADIAAIAFRGDVL